MPNRRLAVNQGFIQTDEDIRAGVRALRRKCPVLRRVHDLTGDPPLRRRPAGLEGLCRIVVAQQLSTASATAIWDRFRKIVDPFEASTMLALGDDGLRPAGLSRPKLRTLRAVAEAVVNGALQLDSLTGATDEAVHEMLTSVSGLGPWSADVFLLFCLGRRDAFAPGDLALQVAAAHAFELGGRPGAVDVLALAERWRPWRGVAARLLWAYYPTIRRNRAGLPV
jgi:DNA-3-methyladenine glycosylase II